jgi:uncharacterized protein
MQFLCDKMCAQLGRWLRIAGYDTAIIETAVEDEKILAQAIAENRILLTRDKFFKRVDPRIVIYLQGDLLEGWVEQLKARGVNWLFSPFSRCLKCNAPLEKIAKPDDFPHTNVEEFWSCPLCHHLYWRGSHTEHMEERLTLWQNQRFKMQ